MSAYNEQYQYQQQGQQQQQQDYWIPDQNQYAGAGFAPGQADSSYNFEMPVQQDFGEELDFQTFDANVASQPQSGDVYGANPYLNVADGGYYQPASAAAAGGGGKFEDFEDEPPLLEELGINPDFILQKDIKAFLDSATDGAVYVSFGSNIKSSALPVAKRNMILQALSELPFKVLWKFEAELENLPKNVKIMKWAPQQDVLRHPNVKLFVTQGGLQSLDEAMYTKTPVLAIPFFGDQRGNAAKVEEAGLGRQLNFFALTKDTLKAAILETAADDTYKLRMEEVHDILTDQPASAVEKTVWWIEYVIRHNGARHMRCPTVDATFIEYYMIDVIGFLLGVVLLALFFIYIGAKLMIKLAKKCLSGRADNAKKLKEN